MPPRPRLVVIGPVPPPTHGVAVSTSLVLANPILAERFRVEHLDTTDPRPLSTVGAWDAKNVSLGLRNLRDLGHCLKGERGIVYLPLSQSTGGFARDSLFVRAAKARGWRVAAHLRGGEFDRVYRGLPRPLRAWARSTLRKIDSVAVMGEGLRGMFDGLVDPARIAVVPNGTPDDFAGVPIEPREREVLFLSNLRERKGLLPAVDAAIRVLAADDTVTLVFAGDWRDDDLRRTVEARTRDHPRMRFETNLKPQDIHRLLSTACVFLFPPVEPEGHPRVVLEALSAGLPIVTTDRGAIADTVEDGRSGFVLADPDPAELAARLLELLGDEHRRQTMARAARARFEERFTQSIADRTLTDWLMAIP